MSVPLYLTNSINGYTPSTEMPIYPKRCGALTPVVASSLGGYWNESELFFQFTTETDGSVIVEGMDGNAIYYPSVVMGETRVTCGRRILTVATIDEVEVTTSVTGNIWVYGGV